MTDPDVPSTPTGDPLPPVIVPAEEQPPASDPTTVTSAAQPLTEPDVGWWVVSTPTGRIVARVGLKDRPELLRRAAAYLEEVMPDV
jgi:hypothetical protein